MPVPRRATRRPVGTLTAAVLAFSAAACRIDFVEPGQGRQRLSRPATLHVIARSAGAPAPDVAVRATLDPGTDADGEVRTVEDDTLRVFDVALTPLPTAPDGALRYSAHWVPAEPSEPAWLGLDMPRVAGVPEPDPPRVYRMASLGPDTTTVERGAPIVLRVRHPADAPAKPAGADDWVLLLDGDGVTLQLGGEGPVPDSLVVPTDWLPDDFVGSLTATLAANDHVSRTTLGDEYRLSITARSRLGWKVRVVPPATGETSEVRVGPR